MPQIQEGYDVDSVGMDHVLEVYSNPHRGDPSDSHCFYTTKGTRIKLDSCERPNLRASGKGTVFLSYKRLSSDGKTAQVYMAKRPGEEFRTLAIDSNADYTISAARLQGEVFYTLHFSTLPNSRSWFQSLSFDSRDSVSLPSGNYETRSWILGKGSQEEVYLIQHDTVGRTQAVVRATLTNMDLAKFDTIMTVDSSHNFHLYDVFRDSNGKLYVCYTMPETNDNSNTIPVFDIYQSGSLDYDSKRIPIQSHFPVGTGYARVEFSEAEGRIYYVLLYNRNNFSYVTAIRHSFEQPVSVNPILPWLRGNISGYDKGLDALGRSYPQMPKMIWTLSR